MSLRSLLREICSGIEIYYTGRSEGEYLKTAFILYDDYSELASKLWLLNDDAKWRDTRDKQSRKYETALKNVAAAAQGTGSATAEEIALIQSGGRGDSFKSYDEVLNDVRVVFDKKRTKEVAALDRLQNAMKARRKQRNGFFHSAHLLSLTIDKLQCVEAFCDLLDYGELLFRDAWREEISGVRNLDTLQVLLRLEKKSFGDPALTERMSRILQNWPRNDQARARGNLVTMHPSDLYLRLCVIHGGPELRRQLETLL